MFANGYNRESFIAKIQEKNNGNICAAPSNKLCYYRSDGNACLIGCFIPDEEYSHEMEFREVDVLIEDYPKLVKYMPFDEIEILVEFQMIHDKYTTDRLPIDFNLLNEVMLWLDEKEL